MYSRAAGEKVKFDDSFAITTLRNFTIYVLFMHSIKFNKLNKNNLFLHKTVSKEDINKILY